MSVPLDLILGWSCSFQFLDVLSPPPRCEASAVRDPILAKTNQTNELSQVRQCVWCFTFRGLLHCLHFLIVPACFRCRPPRAFQTNSALCGKNLALQFIDSYLMLL
jgi:hypothetical protein